MSRPVDVVPREVLAALLMRLEDQRPLIAHMLTAIKAHDEAPPHRCHTTGCGQVREFKAVLMAAAEHRSRNS